MLKQFRLSGFAIVLLALVPLRASAQPVIASLGVRNGGSYALPGLPNSSIAQGSIFIVFGQNLGPAKIVQVSSFPLPTSQGLSGTSVQVTVSGTTVYAIMLYTLAGQVAAVLPSNTPVGSGTVTVTYNGSTSAPAPITVIPSSVGIFSVNQAGSGPGVLQNVNSATDRPLNSATQPATPGQVIILWGTGLGPVTGDEAAGPLPGDMPNLDLHVFVGGSEAPIQYRGRSGCCTGIDQIVFSVPAGVEGCSIPVYAQIGKVLSNFVTMAISKDGTTCTDPNGISPSLLQTAIQNGGLRTGYLSAGRSYVETPRGQYRSDSLSASFSKVSLDALLHSAAAPRAGSCLVIQSPGYTPTANVGLDAGGASATTPAGPYNLVGINGYKGVYELIFSPSSPGSVPGVVNDGTLLKAGTYAFSVTGGADVGSASASIDFPLTFAWTNDASITSIDRSKPLTVTWSGGTAGGLVLIEVQSSASETVSGTLLCYVDAMLGTYTVSSGLLSALPPSYSLSGNPQGAFAISETFVGGTFSASGLDYGSIAFSDTVNKSVAVQ
jgi:uncharacterized protein (TIGR03437 family)